MVTELANSITNKGTVKDHIQQQTSTHKVDNQNPIYRTLQAPDLKDYFEQICGLSGVEYTMPERFLNQRWLSAYDVAMDTQRLFKVYQVFYFAFLPKSLKKDYVDVVVEVSKSLHISTESSKKIKRN